MKDHEIRELVNQLRDVAIKYHGAGQLREQIARVVRAHMLQAGNSPVIPDTWIPVSERMPEREYVLAADFSGKHYSPCQPNTQVGIYADWFDDGNPTWDDGDGNDLHLKRVTHWMPLPAAPQGVPDGK